MPARNLFETRHQPPFTRDRRAVVDGCLSACQNAAKVAARLDRVVLKGLVAPRCSLVVATHQIGNYTWTLAATRANGSRSVSLHSNHPHLSASLCQSATPVSAHAAVQVQFETGIVDGRFPRKQRVCCVSSSPDAHGPWLLTGTLWNVERGSFQASMPSMLYILGVSRAVAGIAMGVSEIDI
jgi:hypothetical protein